MSFNPFDILPPEHQAEIIRITNKIREKYEAERNQTQLDKKDRAKTGCNESALQKNSSSRKGAKKIETSTGTTNLF